MIRALTLICGLQLMGEAAAALFALPVPGPVLGMAALFLIFAATGGPTPDTERAADGLLGMLGLMFVPAGVGVTMHLAKLGEHWPAILSAIGVGTGVALGVTAVAFRILARLTERKPTGGAPAGAQGSHGDGGGGPRPAP
jgi:holin-like protein